MDTASVYTLRAFSVIGALIDNTREVVAPVGELSPIARTYAREKEYFNTATAPGHTLVVFSSKADGEVVQADPVLCNKLLNTNRWLYEQAVGGRFNSSPDSVRTALIQQYGNEFSVWTVGAMIEVTPNVWMPSFLDLRDKVKDEHSYRLWYASEVFEQQFDEYEIFIVPPVADVDVFLATRIEIENALQDMTQDKLVDRIVAIRENYPDTFMHAPMYEWFDPVDPLDPERRIATYWTAVGYGIAGFNDDAIKEAIREHILANSDHTKEEWATIFPEIFTSTELIFTPMWLNYSVPNRELQSGLYSSIVHLDQGLSHLIRMVRGEGYNDDYIREQGEVAAVGYKGIMVPVVGGPYNRDGIHKLSERYPDYISVDTTSVDFSRMSPETRRFVLTLIEMLSIAESMTPDSAVPVGYTRLFRDDILYVSRTLDRFQLIVASKYSTENDIAGQMQEPDL